MGSSDKPQMTKEPGTWNKLQMSAMGLVPGAFVAKFAELTKQTKQFTNVTDRSDYMIKHAGHMLVQTIQ